jgi:glyoxylase-like metal-dependent hydrolase (beta-lactamase superfamily II)
MTDLRLDVYTSPMRDLSNGGQFSPTTATLVLGPTEAVLVDTQYMEADVAELARRITTSGRTLTAIYVTHAHADHYFGLERLLDQFPHARPLALPAVVAGIAAGNETSRSEWVERFGGDALDNTVVPEPLDGDTITVDGQPLRAINVGQADIPNNTILHIPSLDAVITGDVIYNGINPFLAASGPEEWRSWIASVAKVADLKPRIVIAGHKRPELPDDDLTATLDATRDYIQDFSDELELSTDSRDLVARMQRRYPDHGNPSALILSAVTAFRRRKAST